MKITVRKSINIIVKKLGLNPKIIFKGGRRGWIGDNPLIFLDTKKIRSIGWRPKFTIKQSVENTLDYLNKNKWILKKK